MTLANQADPNPTTAAQDITSITANTTKIGRGYLSVPPSATQPLANQIVSIQNLRLVLQNCELAQQATVVATSAALVI